MPAGSAHRILDTLYEAFTANAGPGILPDPGDAGIINPKMNFMICEMVSATAETRTLQNPDRPGVRLILRLLTDGGTVTVTAANGLNAALDTVATFDDAGDFLELVSVTLVANTSYRWETLVQSSTPISSTSPSTSPSSSASSSPSSSPSAT